MNKVLTVIFCVLVMTITAGSDALRGVFLPEFRETFSLTDAQSSHIIMVSYIGNLIFLLLGGYISDRVPKKKFLFGILLIWMTALAAYIFTEDHTILLIGMMFSMGGSTMTATTVNLITPLIFASPAMLVNIFNFCQGVGITVSQNVGGRFSDTLTAWHIANAVIFVIAGISLLLLAFIKLPEDAPKKEKRRISYKAIFSKPQCLILIIICGCYFVAEHGLMNWLTSYGSEHLGYTVEQSAVFLSMFFGSLTVGRLVFAPLVQKLGTLKSLLIYGTVSALMYVIGIAAGAPGIYVIAVMGLGFSILYPTLVLFISEFFDKSSAGSATGAILSAGTLFDIGFNAFFGDMVASLGYGLSIIILPASMVLFAALLFVLKFCMKAPSGGQ